jgi:hypothetical protein
MFVLIYVADIILAQPKAGLQTEGSGDLLYFMGIEVCKT